MSDTPAASVPILLAPDAPAVSIEQAVRRALAELPTGHTGGAQVSFTHVGASARVFVRIKDFETGAVIDRAWSGEVTGGGYISWRF